LIVTLSWEGVGEELSVVFLDLRMPATVSERSVQAFVVMLYGNRRGFEVHMKKVLIVNPIHIWFCAGLGVYAEHSLAEPSLVYKQTGVSCLEEENGSGFEAYGRHVQRAKRKSRRY